MEAAGASLCNPRLMTAERYCVELHRNLTRDLH